MPITDCYELMNQPLHVAYSKHVRDDRNGGPFHAAAEIPRMNGDGHIIRRSAGWLELIRQFLLLKPADQFFAASPMAIRCAS